MALVAMAVYDSRAGRHRDERRHITEQSSQARTEGTASRARIATEVATRRL